MEHEQLTNTERIALILVAVFLTATIVVAVTAIGQAGTHFVTALELVGSTGWGVIGDTDGEREREGGGGGGGGEKMGDEKRKVSLNKT